MKKVMLLAYLLTSINIYGIQIFPSGIKVDFTSPEKPGRKDMLLQTEEDKNTLKTDRFIRVINSMLDLPEGEFLALVFYNEKQKIEGYHIISNSTMPGYDRVFFIDRNSDKNFLGLNDIYSIPKNTVTFGLAIVDTKGKILQQNFKHPDFDENGQVSLEKLFDLSSDKRLMLQYEVVGTYKDPFIKLGAFHFVR